MTTTLSHHGLAPLLAAVFDSPDDDLSRLAYADWLEEHGDEFDRERARFIRAQLEYANLQSEECACGYTPWDPCDVCRLRNVMGDAGMRQSVIAVMHFADVCSVTPREPLPGSYAVFHRGWIDEVCLAPEDFLAHAGAIFREHPVRRVTLLGKRPASNWRGGEKVCWFKDVSDEPGRGIGNTHWIPPSLFDLIRSGPHRCYAKMFPTEEQALDALSDACCRHGREEARKL